jgi:predicted Zn-dependent protease
MRTRALWVGTLLAGVAQTAALAEPHHGGHHGSGHGWHHHHPIVSPVLLGVGGGWGSYLVPVWSPVVFRAPAPVVFDRGELLAGPMPSDPLRGLPRQPPAPAAAKRADPARSAHFVTLGDRLFRAGNTRKAEERYEQAVRSDPGAAAPHIRLAQLGVVRGKYAEAANEIREAQAAQPGWLVRAPDVQALFGEPSEFARHIATLESHLQANPNDRDAWLVLGAEWFLSGRTRKAADVFLRLADRQPEPALAAFLDATTPRAPEGPQ